MESTLQTQLDFSQQLNSVIESVVTRFDKLVVNTQTQSDHIVNLVQEIEKSKQRMNDLLLKSENLVAQVTASLEENYIKNIQRFSEKSREAFALNTNQMKYNFKLMINLITISNKDFDNLIKRTSLSAKQIQSLDKIRKALNKNNNALDDLQNDADSTNSTLEAYEGVAEKANMAKNAIFTGGASLLIDIPKIIFGFIGSMINSMASLTGALAKFYSFVQTIPFTIGKIAASIGNQIRQELMEVIHAAGEEAKDVFDLSSRIGKGAASLRDKSKELLKEMQNPRTRLAQLLGTGASGLAAFEKESFSLVDSMGHYAEVFGPFVLNNIENAKYLIEVQRAIGVGAQEMSYYAIEMYNSGKNPVDFMHELSSTIKNAADMNDVDMKQIAPSIHKLKMNIVDFGHMTSTEISNLVVKLRKMRVSTDDAVSVFKKFTSLEEASKASAMLFQSFNMNIDAFDLLTSRDPGEMLTQFRNAMRSTGKSFESLSRHEKALLQSITGISDQGLSSMMSMMDANMSYEEARKKMDQHDPVKQKTKMIKGLTTAIKQFQKIVQFESPFSAFFQGLMENVLSQQNLQGQLINFNKVYESIYQIAFNITPEEIQGITRPLVAVLTKIKNIFTGGGIEKLMTSVAKVASGFVSDISVDLLSKKESKQFLSFRLKVQETLKLLKHNEAEAVKSAMLNEASSNLSSLKPFLDSKEASSTLKGLFEKDKNGVYSLTKGITVDSLLETLTNSAENLPENSQYKKTLQNFRFRLSRIYEQKVKNLNKSGTLNQASKAVTNRLSVKGRIDSLYENLLGLFSEGQPLFIEFHNLSGRIMGAIVEGALSGMIALLEIFNGGVDKSVAALNIASEKEIKKQFPNKDPKKATLLDLMGITRSNYDELGNELSQESSRFVERLPSLMSIAGKLMGDLLGIFGTFASSLIGLVGGFSLAYYEKQPKNAKGEAIQLLMKKAGFNVVEAARAAASVKLSFSKSDTLREMIEKLDKVYGDSTSLANVGAFLNLYDNFKKKYHKDSQAYKFLNSSIANDAIKKHYDNLIENQSSMLSNQTRYQKLNYVIHRMMTFGEQIEAAFPSNIYDLIDKSNVSNKEVAKKAYNDAINSFGKNYINEINNIVSSSSFGSSQILLNAGEHNAVISNLITQMQNLFNATGDFDPSIEDFDFKNIYQDIIALLHEYSFP